MDERRQPPLRRAARELCVRVRGYEQADKFKNTHFDFDVYDAYDWYLKLGPLSNINAKYLHNSIPAWNAIVAHPNYDAFNKREAWYTQIKGSTVPNLNVAGFWDQEDPWGPWQIFHQAAKSDPDHTNFMVAGPWFHGSWHTPVNDSIGIIPLGGHATAREFRENIEAPFFRYYLHGKGTKPAWRATMFQTGSNTWKTYDTWPVKGATPTNLYLHSDGTLSFDKPAAPARRTASTSPIRRARCRIGSGRSRRRIRTATGAAGKSPINDSSTGGPDVLSYTSAPLDRDVTVTGALSATLFASTSGTDADFVVKLIDVYPGERAAERLECRSGPAARRLCAFSQRLRAADRDGDPPRPVQPELRDAACARAEQADRVDVPLREHDHVFRKGHRIMVQVQSTWFPIIDRNPQKFVPSIYEAKASDYVKATQRVYATPALPSHITLPVVP